MKKQRVVASVLALALTVTSVCVYSGEADAAKKVSMKSKAEVSVGKTVKLKVKNGNKKAKVTWKSSKSKVAKITKKTTKGNKATATVKGIKKGKANITATYKLGKKKTKLTCKVTVGKKTTNPTPNVSNGPSQPTPPVVTAVPTQSVPTATPAPSGKPTPTPTPKPTQKPTPSPDVQIYKTYKDIVVDGDIDTAWDFADKMEIKNWTPDTESSKAQTSNAYAKVLWTEKNVYIMVEAEDPEIDSTNEAAYNQDSVELFVDEYDFKEDWGKSNEFQYRTVLDEKAETIGSLTDKTFWDGGDIKTAFKKTDKGYVVEWAVPLNKAPSENGFIGIELQINDAQGGKRNGTWNLFADPANGDATPYDSTMVFGDCQYAIKREPKEIVLNFSDPDSTNMELPDQFSERDANGNIPYYDENGNVVCTKTIESLDDGTIKTTYKDADGKEIEKPVGNKKPTEEYATMNTQARYDSENGLVYCETANNIVIYFPEDRRVLLNEKAKIAIEGTYTVDEGTEIADEDTVFRTWMVDTENKKLTGDGPVTTSNQIYIPYSDIKSDNGEFKWVGDLEATGPDKEIADDGYKSDGTCDALMIKAPSWNATIGKLVLKSVVLTVFDPVIPDDNPDNSGNPDDSGNPDNPGVEDVDVVLSADTAHPDEGKPYWYVSSADNVYNEDGSVSFALPKAQNKGIGFYFAADKASVDLAKYSKAVITLSSSDENVPLRAIVSKSDKLFYDENIVVENDSITAGTNDVSVELDLSKCQAGDIGYGVAISHRGWASSVDNPTITVKSIKLVAKK